MTKILYIDNCEQCSHHQLDPQVTDSKMWGKDVCTYFATLNTAEWDETKIRIIENMDEIPKFCMLESLGGNWTK